MFNMRILFFISVFFYLSFASSKTVIFTGVYPGIDINSAKKEQDNKSDLYYMVLKGILDGKNDIKDNKVTQSDINYLNDNLWKVSKKLYSSVDTTKIKDIFHNNKFESIDDLKSTKVNIKDLVVSFISIDDILTFSEQPKQTGSLNVATRAEIYIMSSFYAIDMATMRLIYSTQFVIPMNEATENFNKNTYRNMLARNSSKYYDVIVIVSDRSLN